MVKILQTAHHSHLKESIEAMSLDPIRNGGTEMCVDGRRRLTSLSLCV